MQMRDGPWRLPRLQECRHQRSNRNLRAGLDQKLRDGAVVPTLDVDRGLAGIHHGDDLALLDDVTGLDQPFQQRPFVHVSAQGGQRELDHVASARVAAQGRAFMKPSA
jgi:hypothetical protein